MKIITWMRKNKIFVVALLSLFIAFSGLTFREIHSFLGSLIISGPPDHTITSADAPTLSNISLPLNVSPIYYAITHVSINEKEIAFAQNLRLNFHFENRGKTRVQEPILKLYFVDSLGQVRAFWVHPLSEEEFGHGCDIGYVLPPADQMVLGSWNVISLLYDNKTAELVSYSVQDFTVVQSKQEELFIMIMLIVTTVMTAGVGFLTFVSRMMKRAKKASRKVKESQKSHACIMLLGRLFAFLFI